MPACTISLRFTVHIRQSFVAATLTQLIVRAASRRCGLVRLGLDTTTVLLFAFPAQSWRARSSGATWLGSGRSPPAPLSREGRIFPSFADCLGTSEADLIRSLRCVCGECIRQLKRFTSDASVLMALRASSPVSSF